ncbi:uncharacterized protein LOC105803746 [Gossypium raimondii]|uniref:DUF8204 domain-containing protein n=3 Tax=Gossypium TaxID=3633 RepID=A0A0D2QW25_GOSRA|nr:uncharacterized protein LOC105803746 [Gossypium raimondii]KJB43388.1 hypothetical protein B456_007G197500 [Gossypium raimondii]
MERNREEERKQNLEKENKEGNENENGTVKSCKGFLFYSSALKSHNRDPLCIGIPRSLPQVKSHNVGLAEVKANRNSAVVEDFSFVCAGYSLFMSKNEGSITKDGTKPQLPHCRGLAYLQHLAPPNPNPASAPAHVHSKGDHGVHQHQTRKSTYAVEDDFLNRFTRKANLIASRVARDMCRVGNNIKNNVEDILFSSRRPPK